MLYQKAVMIDTDGGIGFGFGVIWKYHHSNIPVFVARGILFPIAVLCFNYKKLGQSLIYRFAWLQYALGFCEAYFFYEKGFRMADGNFLWGYHYGTLFLFIVSVIILVQSDGKKSVKITQWAFYGAHLLCGILCFAKIFLGGS